MSDTSPYSEVFTDAVRRVNHQFSAAMWNDRHWVEKLPLASTAFHATSWLQVVLDFRGWATLR
jgi:hypothetical protein